MEGKTKALRRHLVLRSVIYVFLIGALVTLGKRELSAQVDTLFWFAAPDFSDGHGDAPIYMRFTSLDEDVELRISQPANPGFTAITASIPANSSYTLDLTAYKDLIESAAPDEVNPTGLLIESSAYLNVYYENASHYNPEIFTLKGQNALGTSFVIPMQDLFPNGNYRPVPYASFNIVATEDNTTVTITPADAIVGHNAGDEFTVVLNRGEVYVARARVTAAGRHLGGSVVKTDKAVAITIADDSMAANSIYGSCADLGGDQITSVDQLGQTYITVPGFLNNPNDGVFVQAVEDNTVVVLNGDTVATLNIGESYQAFSNGAPIVISTSSPVYVLHMSGFGCELGLDQMPPLNPCNGSRLLSINRSSAQSLFVNVLVYKGLLDAFLFNGRADIIQASDFSEVAGTQGEWFFARKEIPVNVLGVNQAALIENTKGPFQLSVIHGGPGTGTMYGYFSDYGKLDILPDIDVACAGGTVLVLDTNYQSYLWNTGDKTRELWVESSGVYSVTVTNEYGCVASDTVDVKILPEARGSESHEVCDGDSVFVHGVWLGQGVSSHELVLPGRARSGCDSIVEVFVRTLPVTRDQLEYTICEGDSVLIGGKWFASEISTESMTLKKANQFGCDSLIEYSISFFEAPEEHVVFHSCPGDSIHFLGNVLTENHRSADILLPGASVHGCDSVVHVSVEYFATAPDTVEIWACESETVSYLGHLFKEGEAFEKIVLESADMNGCDSLVFVELRRFTNNSISVSDTLCPGESVLIGGKWFGGRSESDTIQLRNADTNGCDSVIFVEAFVPTNYLSLPKDNEVEFGQTIRFDPQYGNPFVSWSWESNDTLSCTDCEHPELLVKGNANVYVNAYDQYGCLYTASSVVRVKKNKKVFIPNAITVNDDGVNDGFTAFGNQFVEGIEFIEIFDRWGNLVFRIDQIPANQPARGWDGTHKGQKVMPGVFAYRVKLSFVDGSSEVFYGDVTVLR